ncbi:MAG: hypothetical protein K6B72_01360 [Lachnospiraceae bacterium]|nr:hypothetical protein [Lachnospiraceae bacterium]
MKNRVIALLTFLAISAVLTACGESKGEVAKIQIVRPDETAPADDTVTPAADPAPAEPPAAADSYPEDTLPATDPGDAGSGTGQTSDDSRQGILDLSLDMLEDLSGIETVNGEVYDTLTLPSSLMHGITQDRINRNAGIGNYEYGKVNEDGSATFTMTKAQHAWFLKNLEKRMDEKLNEYADESPLLARIERNEDFTGFRVYITGEDVTAPKEVIPAGVYVLGGAYARLSGVSAESIHVDLVDEATGEVIETADFKDPGNTPLQ